MEKADLERYEERLFLDSIFFGAWHRRRAAQALAEDGSTDALRLLAKALSESEDRDVRSIALQVLQEAEAGSSDALGSAEWVVDPPVDALEDEDAKVRRQAQSFFAELEDGPLRSTVAPRLWQRWHETRSRALEAGAEACGCVADEPLRLKVVSALKLRKRQVLTGMGEAVVKPLRSFCEDPDATVAEQARVALAELAVPAAQEAVCALVVDERDSVAKEAALEGGYAPDDERQRALLYLLTEQWDEYETLDHDHRRLQTAYDAADEALRQSLREKLRASGRPGFVSAFTRGDLADRLASMRKEEVDFIARQMISGGRAVELWNAAKRTSALVCAVLVQNLSAVNWQPSNDGEKALFDEISKIADDVKGLEQPKLRIIPRKSVDDTTRIEDEIEEEMNVCRSVRKKRSRRRRDTQPWKQDKLVYSPRFDQQEDLFTLRERQIEFLKIPWLEDPVEIELSKSDEEIRLVRIPQNREFAVGAGKPCGADQSSRHLPLKTWKLPEGTLISKLDYRLRVEFAETHVSPDGRFIALINSEEESYPQEHIVDIYSLPEFEFVGQLSKEVDSLGGDTLGSEMAFSPDGNLLATACKEAITKNYQKSMVEVWSLPQVNCLSSFVVQDDPFYGYNENLIYTPERIIGVRFIHGSKCLAVKTSISRRNMIKQSQTYFLQVSNGKQLAVFNRRRIIEDYPEKIRKYLILRVYLNLWGDALTLGGEASTVDQSFYWKVLPLHLCDVPVSQITPEDIDRVERLLDAKSAYKWKLSDAASLHVLLRLYKQHRRFDISVGNASYDSGAEHDIEIETT